MKVINSLWFKVVGAFALVIAILLVVVSLMVSRQTHQEFDRYLVGSGQIWTQFMAPVLAEMYVAYDGWQDPQSMLASPWLMPPSPAVPSTMMQNSGRHSGTVMVLGSDFWSRMGWRLILTDADGMVIGDTGESFLGERFDQSSLDQGTPIEVADQRVGTLLFVSPIDYAPLQQSFLSATNEAVFVAGSIAGGVALLVGTLIVIGITRPLSRLQAVAEQVADGDLSVRVSVNARDELGTVAEAFNHMAEGLEQQQLLRQQMVADIAHELRTPISVIQGTLEAMLDGVITPNQAELQDLHSETHRLSRLVEDLRVLSLADAGQLTLRIQDINLAEFVENLVNRMKPIAAARHVTLDTRIAQSLPATIDPDRIAQALTNLVDNAIRYTPSGGEVIVQLSQHDSDFHISVTDSGPGIPPHDLPYVFERFWRGDKSRNRHTGGSGLGLAIVKQLIELHRGTIQAKSQPGQGSTFLITLPVHRAEFHEMDKQS